MNNWRHGLYAKTLRDSYNDEERKLFDEVPVTTDLSPELAVARTNVARFRTMLGNGITKLVSGTLPDGTPREHDVETLLEKALSSVRKLSQAQHDMNPASNVGGSMTLKIKLAPGAKVELDKQADAGLEDLDSDGGEVIPLQETPDAPAKAPADSIERSVLDGLDDE